MKIAYDYQIFHSQIYGGISRYFAELTQHINIDTEYQAKIFAPIYRNQYIKNFPKEQISGHFIAQYPKKTARLFSMINQARSASMITRWQADIVHETYYAPKATSKGKPIFLTVYDMIHELFPEQFASTDPTKSYKELALKRAQHIICISESTKHDLLNLYNIPEEKTSVIYLGFSQAPISIEQAIITLGTLDLQALKDTYPKPFLLYVGARGGYKNFTRFIQAVAQNQRLKQDFNIIAFGGGAFNPEELHTQKQLGFLEHQIQQISGSDDILAALYRQAHAFIYPSLYEGFGLPPLEAMAQDCPVLASNTSSIPEVVGNAGVYFNPYEVDDIAAKIEEVVYSAERKQQLITQGSQQLKQFSWEKCAAETLKVYQTQRQ